MKPQKKALVSILKRRWFLYGIAAALSLILFSISPLQVNARELLSPRKLAVKAVVVTMFEVGNDIGDSPGEFQYWAEREKLNKVYALPAAYHDVRANSKGVIGIVTGEGTARAATSIMALGLDQRFDLSKAYWLVAGIAGIDPNDGSLGSAAWAKWTVDGDLGYEIDAREIPSDWPYGYYAFGTTRPNQTPPPSDSQVYQLNSSLVDWAYQLTKNVQLEDTSQMANYRATYTTFPNAQKPPFVLLGDNMASSTFWHGNLLNNWANDWLKLWTGGAANFVTTAEEDTGTLRALTNLAQLGLVDLNRVMILRTASNYSMQGTDQTAAESLNHEIGPSSYSGFIPSLEAAYRVGSTVIHEITNNWKKYEGTIPGS